MVGQEQLDKITHLMKAGTAPVIFKIASSTLQNVM
jgi:hypothetical protein